MSRSMEPFGPFVNADWLSGHLDDVHVFDCRKYLDGRSGRAEYERSHIAGAVFADLDSDLSAPPSKADGRHPFPSAEHFADAMSRLGYDASRPAVAYDDVGGAMAARLWFMLTLVGVPAAILNPGIQSWSGPTESGAHPSESAQSPKPDAGAARFAVREWPADRLVDADEVERRINNGGVVVDARSADRFRGEPNAIDDRFGHVPGAINLAWADNLNPATGEVLSVEALGDRYQAIVEAATTSGPRPVMYCGSGVTACHNLAALSLLDTEADLYVGSWSQWGADLSRPVETGDASSPRGQ